jgi:hypothetical protein
MDLLQISGKSKNMVVVILLTVTNLTTGVIPVNQNLKAESLMILLFSQMLVMMLNNISKIKLGMLNSSI